MRHLRGAGAGGRRHQHGTAGAGDADHLSPPVLRSVARAGVGGQGLCQESRQAEGLKELPFPSVAVQSGLWPALLARMKIDPEAFITRHLDQIIPRITTQSPLNQVVGPVSWLWPQVSSRQGRFGETEDRVTRSGLDRWVASDSAD